MWLVTACLLGSVLSIIIGKGWSKVYLSLHAYPEWYLPASIILTLFVLDTYAYFSHRFILHGPLYESVHRIHHLSTRPDIISQFQLSPIEQLITSAFLIAVICIIPLHPIALLVVSAFTLLRGILSHSGIEIFPKGHLNRPWASWLNPNIHHDLHHRHFNCHYALHFRWWDRLLRTEHPEYEADYAEAIKRVEGKKLAKGIH
jgi:sterol desaturase/sphingolipid hydroxylase (fatty acid hydroxylase superfamily)